MDWSDVQAAMVARVRSRVRYLQTVRSYQGDPAALLDETPTVATPAVLVKFLGDTLEVASGQVLGHQARFLVLGVAQSYRGDEAAREGVDGSIHIGVYHIIRDALAALVNDRLTAEFTAAGVAGRIDRLRPTLIEPYVGEGPLAVYGMHVDAAWDTDEGWPA